MPSPLVLATAITPAMEKNEGGVAALEMLSSGRTMEPHDLGPRREQERLPRLLQVANRLPLTQDGNGMMQPHAQIFLLSTR